MCPTGTYLLSQNSDESTSGFRQAFDVLDTDHDGKISIDDLRSFYSSFTGADDGEDIIPAMIAVADANKDGFVQYEEFEVVLKGRKLRNIKKEEGDHGERSSGGVMEEIFKVMDEDGDGKLGLEDLKGYLNRVGLQVEEEDIKGMIRMGGGDEIHGVSFDAFVNILSLQDFVC